MSDDLFAMQWLVGDSLTSIEYDAEANSWSLAFERGAWLGVPCLWRLLRGGRVIATSSDHGHWFGLLKPFDAVNALRVLASLRISEVEVQENTADLLLKFGDRSTALQIIPTSAAYEAWHAVRPGIGEVIATGGGELMKIDTHEAGRARTSMSERSDNDEGQPKC